MRKNFSPANYSLSVQALNGTEIFHTNDPAATWDGFVNNTTNNYYKYIIKVQFTAWGKTIDTCTYLFIMDSKDGCIPTVATDKNKYIFEDQLDPNTGTIPYPTSEVFCP